MITERRKVERAEVFFIVEFRPHNGAHACSAGIVSNLSQAGFNFESQDFKLKPRKTLEFTLKHPDSEWSLKAAGTIVWRRDGWYKCVRGIKITNVDEENRQKILETVSFERNKSSETVTDEKDQMKVMENEEGNSAHEVVNIAGGVERADSKETVNNVVQKLMSDDGRVHDKKEWYHALFDQATDCMLLMEVQPDGSPVIIDVNESACSIHGYKKEELTGKPISFLEAPGSRGYDPGAVQSLLKGDALKFEAIHMRKDTKTFQVLESAQLIIAYGKSYIVAVEREITYDKKNEEVLPGRIDELKQKTSTVATGYSRRIRGFITVSVLLIVVLAVIVSITFNNEQGVYIADQGDVKKKSIPFIDSLYPDVNPPGILLATMYGVETFDITRVRLPEPEKEIHQQETPQAKTNMTKNSESERPKLKKVIRRRPPLYKKESSLKTGSKHPLEVIAGPQKEAIIYEELFDENANNWNTFDTGEASAFLEGGVYNRKQEDIRCNMDSPQSFKSHAKRLQFVVHQRCK